MLNNLQKSYNDPARSRGGQLRDVSQDVDNDDDDDEEEVGDEDEESGEDNLLAAYGDLLQEDKDKGAKGKDDKNKADDEFDAKKAMEKNPFLRYGTGI